MTVHISLDIKTWGKKPGCDIRSIGAVVFDRVTGEVGGPDGDDDPAYCFYIATDNPGVPVDMGVYEHPAEYPHYCGVSEMYRKYNLTRDPETVEWWNKQGEEAQGAFDNPTELKTALQLFSLWYAGVVSGEERDTVQLWTKGPHFDIAILQAAYDAVGLQAPWHYRSPRDMRTTMSDAGMTRDQENRTGIAHHALHDAISQALTICEAWQRLMQPYNTAKVRGKLALVHMREIAHFRRLNDQQATEITALKRLRDDLHETTNRYLDRARTVTRVAVEALEAAKTLAMKHAPLSVAPKVIKALAALQAEQKDKTNG